MGFHIPPWEGVILRGKDKGTDLSPLAAANELVRRLRCGGIIARAERVNSSSRGVRCGLSSNYFDHLLCWPTSIKLHALRKLSQVLLSVKVLRKVTAFALWKAINSHWNKNTVCQVYSVIVILHLLSYVLGQWPIGCMYLLSQLLQEKKDSKIDSTLYLAVLLTDALLAAASGSLAVHGSQWP